MIKVKGLRRRWLLNAVALVSVLGLICVICVTLAVSAYYYSAMESDMRYRAKTSTEFFGEYLNQGYYDYYKSCAIYAQTFDEKNTLELQFIDAQGQLVASSYGQWVGVSPTTTDVTQALETGKISSFVGKDPNTGEGIMAVSSPVVYGNGQIIGILRYVTATRQLNMQILIIGCFAFGALFVAIMAMVIGSNYYMHTILVPLREIIEKAKRITNGSYGIQIQTRYDDEVGELAETINEMSLKISENEKLQTDFISSLSHELRTPLTAITGWSETLLSGEDLDENTQRGVKIIYREAVRMTEMVVELLDFTRIQDGRMTLNMELADIRSEFEDTVYMYGSRLAQDGITLEYVDNDQDIPEITCDPKRLRQVFLNILDNAAKHGGEGKRIQAEILWENDEVVVNIRDFGPGIPEDELPLVTKKFYKGSSKARGSGIGLAVCDEIVQLHGGTLTLSNAEGGGTLVSVRIPATQ